MKATLLESVIISDKADKILIVKELVDGKVTYNVPTWEPSSIECYKDYNIEGMQDDLGINAANISYVGSIVYEHNDECYFTKVYVVFSDMITHNPETQLHNHNSRELILPESSNFSEAIWMNRTELEAVKEQWKDPFVLKKFLMFKYKLRLRKQKLGEVPHPCVYMDRADDIYQFSPTERVDSI